MNKNTPATFHVVETNGLHAVLCDSSRVDVSFHAKGLPLAEDEAIHAFDRSVLSYFRASPAGLLLSKLDRKIGMNLQRIGTFTKLLEGKLTDEEADDARVKLKRAKDKVAATRIERQRHAEGDAVAAALQSARAKAQAHYAVATRLAMREEAKRLAVAVGPSLSEYLRLQHVLAIATDDASQQEVIRRTSLRLAESR